MRGPELGSKYAERHEPLNNRCRKFQFNSTPPIKNQARCAHLHTREILSNQPEIRLYLAFSDWFGTKRTSVWIQINLKMVNTIWFRVDLTRFRKHFSGCRLHVWSLLFFQSSSTIEKYVLLRKSHSLTIAPWKILVIDGKFRA